MDTPSTSVSGAIGRSTKKKKVPDRKKTGTTDSRDFARTPPILIKVNSWMSTIEVDCNRSSPDFPGFDNENDPPYNLISNTYFLKDKDELEQYYTISDSISEILVKINKSFMDLSPGTRRRKFSNIIEQDLDNCDIVLPSPENENKKEFCKYLQLMKPTDKKKSVIIVQNRHSKRIKNLSQQELEKKSRTLISDQENDSINKSEEKLLEHKAPPKPPDKIDVIDFDGIAEENWFKELANRKPKRTAVKRKSNVSVEDLMSAEFSEAEKETNIPARTEEELFDSNNNRSKSRGPAIKRNSVDALIDSVIKNKSNRRAKSNKRLNGAQIKNGLNGKAKEIEENDLINIKTRSMEPIINNNEIKDLTQTAKTNDQALINEPAKVGKRKANNSKQASKVKGPGFKIRLSSAKRGRNTNSNTSTKSAPKPRQAKRKKNNSAINEKDFDIATNAIQEHINLLKKPENPAEIYLSESSCSEVEPETSFGSQLKNWPRKNSNLTIKKICIHESDPPSTANKSLERHDSAIQTDPEVQHEFHSQILNIQKTSDEDSEEELSEKSSSPPASDQFTDYAKQQTEDAKWINTKKQLENQNSITVNTGQGPILKIFYVDFDLVLCQELLVSFWYQSAPGNVLGAQDMWTSKGSIQRQPMPNNCTLKESLEMVACSYFSLAYIELWTKEHENYQQEVPVTNVYAVVYFWMKQYNGSVKKVLQLGNINGFADDIQYSIVKSSPKIVVSWHFTGNEMNRKKTYVYCYQVASDFQSICNVDNFEAVDHYVSSLHNIEGCDTLIMGCGENKITLWNIEGGRLAATIEMTEIKSPLATLWVKCDRGFLFTLQQCVDRELRLIAIHSMNHSWKRLASYKPPLVYDRLKGVCVENGVVLGFYDQGIVCWNAKTAEIVVENAGRTETEYISGNYLISVAGNEVNVQHAFISLLKLGYWN
ncbi:unnamed protein product [Ceutorhynchus assimilis]|uniref:Uncharacterized protein n=2 Tax=Ceutorhynchus assimilis TaxID=467358 RepID=A0A9P0GX79_9CUCU|nr:unnamed protein product [Ceutorhynchus assimilis]